LCRPAPLACGNYSGIKLNAIPGIGLKLFGFIAESVFTITPESCSGSPRNTVRNHPGMAFGFDRIPHDHGSPVKRCKFVYGSPHGWHEARQQ
jgi:hypothetical protein